MTKIVKDYRRNPENIKALYLAIVFLILGGLGCLKYIVPDIIA